MLQAPLNLYPMVRAKLVSGKSSETSFTLRSYDWVHMSHLISLTTFLTKSQGIESLPRLDR